MAAGTKMADNIACTIKGPSAPAAMATRFRLEILAKPSRNQEIKYSKPNIVNVSTMGKCMYARSRGITMSQETEAISVETNKIVLLGVLRGALTSDDGKARADNVNNNIKTIRKINAYGLIGGCRKVRIILCATVIMRSRIRNTSNDMLPSRR